jgi:hypothetical protein
MYYNRFENEVIEIDDYEDAIRGVHLPLDYTRITNKRLDSVIKLILAEMKINDVGFEKEFLNEVLEKEAAKANMFAFNQYYFDKIADSLSKHNSLVSINKSELKKQVLAIIATDYLEFANAK